MKHLTPWFLTLWTATFAWGQEPRPFGIHMVDEQTGRGVPLVELRTVHGLRLVTDNQGLAAFHEPGLMDRDVFFTVTSHGYEFPRDGFGFRGKTLRTTPGGRAELKIRRVNLAERLYRVTGAGLYRDSLWLGAKVPIRAPLLNAQVVGSDSVLNAVYRNKIYWFWGDTNRPAYPLGNFHVPGATSELPNQGGLDPDVGIDLTYWVDAKGFAKPTAKLPGKGPTWLTTLVPLPDASGQERLCGSYVKVEPPLKIYARGLMQFDDASAEFVPRQDISMQAPLFPAGHALRHKDAAGDHVYFAHPYPLIRVRATAEDFFNPQAYEAYTCWKAPDQLDRDDAGLRYAWRKGLPIVGPSEEAKLRSAGRIQEREFRWHPRDRATGKTITPHNGSLAWNDYRQRWVMIFVQSGGTSLLGEVWYAEAESLLGPWREAVKVVTHDRYSFYNPKLHPMFDKDRGRFVYFEGTYTHTFSGNPDATPRYDYNQVLYKLDLADPRLHGKPR